jgi:hypothetical protein
MGARASAPVEVFQCKDHCFEGGYQELDLATGSEKLELVIYVGRIGGGCVAEGVG